MGYSTYVAIALPAIGYDSLCTLRAAGRADCRFVDVANKVLGGPDAVQITLHEAGMMFLHVPAGCLDPDWLLDAVDRRQRQSDSGRLAAVLLTGAVIGVVAYFTNRHDNLVVLTGVMCGWP